MIVSTPSSSQTAHPQLSEGPVSNQHPAHSIPFSWRRWVRFMMAQMNGDAEGIEELRSLPFDVACARRRELLHRWELQQLKRRRYYLKILLAMLFLLETLLASLENVVSVSLRPISRKLINIFSDLVLFSLSFLFLLLYYVEGKDP